MKGQSTASHTNRRSLGQWYTPDPVADLALTLALRSAPKAPLLLDPSCGDGVFLRRARALGVASTNLLGVDLDSRAVASARESLPGATIWSGDFFDLAREVVPRVHVIAGNPPYVRQERVSAQQKACLLTRLKQGLEEEGLDSTLAETLVGRSDLAAPFVLQALLQLRRGGVASLVLSSAFFDSGYGELFWKISEKIATLRMVVSAPAERWFADAAVHTVIALFEKEPSEAPVRVLRLRESTAACVNHLAAGGRLAQVGEERLVDRSAPGTWASALRAPSVWFRLVEAAGDALVPLGDLAALRRGITSGANDIFYLSVIQAMALGLSECFLRPLLTARGRGGRGAIEIAEGELEQCVLAIPKGCDLASHPALRDYLKSFADASARRSLAARSPWWSLRVSPGHVFLCKAYGERFVQPFSEVGVVADQRMYCLQAKSGLNSEFLSAMLNSNLTALALESTGRASMGQGVLELTVADAMALPVLDLRKHPCPQAVLDAFSVLRRRRIAKISSEVSMADRQALDQALLSPWPHLARMQAALRGGLAAACSARVKRPSAAVVLPRAG